MQISGSSALVAGGAWGLGEATARRLHADGAQVVIADLNQERGEQLAPGRRSGAPRGSAGRGSGSNRLSWRPLLGPEPGHERLGRRAIPVPARAIQIATGRARRNVPTTAATSTAMKPLPRGGSTVALCRSRTRPRARRAPSGARGWARRPGSCRGAASAPSRSARRGARRQIRAPRLAARTATTRNGWSRYRAPPRTPAPPAAPDRRSVPTTGARSLP